MMKKLVMLAALLFASFPVFAGWMLVQESHDGILYIDRDDAEKTANGWKVNSSQDCHKAQRFGDNDYLSAKTRHEIDCAANKVRTLSVELFPENMAGGGALHTDTKPGEWAVPAKGSGLDLIWSSMCR